MKPAKEIIRCPWSCGVSDLYETYHDKEWGVPCYDDQTLFEFIILEGAQAGLSWSTVLNKREGYRKAFDQFDAKTIARYTDKKIEKLMLNPAIIRNRLKINATVTNARCFLEVQKEFKTFSNYIWQFVNHKPIQNKWKTQQQVPATSTESDAISKDLKKRGFKFVGSTIIYAHMQATGMVNDHITDCFRYNPVKKLSKS